MENSRDIPTKKQRLKPKVVREWEESEVFKLIALVESQESLWNAANGTYHNKVARENAWQNISKSFQNKYSTRDLIAKWTNLRIQYRGYASRAKTKSGQKATKPPKWKFYSAMSLIDRSEEQQTQRTVSNNILEVDSESNSIDAQPISSQIAETMKEAVALMKERNENVLHPNESFAIYMLSELKTLSEDASASIRRKVAYYFLQCVEEERNFRLLSNNEE